MLSCSASATAISVGEVRDATRGTPIRAALSSISEETRPVDRRTRSSVGIPRMSASPLTLSTRSEEHTSELQSHSDLVCRLLLEKKKKQTKHIEHTITNKTSRMKQLR